jgi:hypothetical protein
VWDGSPRWACSTAWDQSIAWDGYTFWNTCPAWNGYEAWYLAAASCAPSPPGDLYLFGGDPRRLHSQARLIPATGSPATLAPAYVPQIRLGLTVLPRATIFRALPDIPLPAQFLR